MKNTIQLYTDESRKVKGYPITSPDRVLYGDGKSIKDKLKKTVKFDVVGEGETTPPIEGELDKIKESVESINEQLDKNIHQTEINKQFVNVISLGVKNDGSIDCTDIIHEALDRGLSLFFPNGRYKLKYLKLKSYNVLVGENHHETYLVVNKESNEKNFIQFDSDVNQHIRLENFFIIGSKEGMGLVEINARLVHDKHGGLWDSIFKNINTLNWKGNGVKLLGGGNTSQLPIQNNVFENVIIIVDNLSNNSYIPLTLEGQVEQNIFIRCSFSGNDSNKTITSDNSTAILMRRRRIDNNISGDMGSGSNTFIQCYFGGTYLCIKAERSYNPTFINCYYENASKFAETSHSSVLSIIGGFFTNVSGSQNMVTSGQTCSINLINVAPPSRFNVFCYILNNSCSNVVNTCRSEVACINSIFEIIASNSLVHFKVDNITNVEFGNGVNTDVVYVTVLLDGVSTLKFTGSNFMQDVTINDNFKVLRITRLYTSSARYLIEVIN